ncbi:MAG TPA: hypothetical protein VKY74_08065 [Chloroflexia bacterium]|nr:hypothetical protein [Chloroflexia bacterium]
MDQAAVLVKKAPGAAPRRPVGAVVEWELRRFAAHRGLWLLGGCLFAIFAGLIPLMHPLMSSTFVGPDTLLPLLWFVEVVGGFEALKIAVVVLCMGLLASEVQHRTHELVMATALPTGAYVWGRWLAGLILCGGLSLLLLGGVLTGAWIVNLVDPANSLPPNGAAIFSVWAFVAAVDVPVISALALVAGACWPRRIVAGSVGLTLLCILGPQLVRLDGEPPAWVPNHLWMLGNLLGHYANQVQALVTPYIPEVPNEVPAAVVGLWRQGWTGPVDLTPWLAQLGYAGLAVGLVAILAWRFRRFRS